jgi:hypothetical protein
MFSRDNRLLLQARGFESFVVAHKVHRTEDQTAKTKLLEEELLRRGVQPTVPRAMSLRPSLGRGWLSNRVEPRHGLFAAGVGCA